jgi:ketosteroid isomerase-like protein
MIMGESAERPVTVGTLVSIVEAFNRHDVDGVMAFFADDCSMDLPRGSSPWGTRCVGKQAVREAVAARFAGIPDVHYAADRHWVCENYGVSEWTLTGTTLDGMRVEVRGCDHLEFRAGKLVRKDSYWKIAEP